MPAKAPAGLPASRAPEIGDRPPTGPMQYRRDGTRKLVLELEEPRRGNGVDIGDDEARPHRAGPARGADHKRPAVEPCLHEVCVSRANAGAAHHILVHAPHGAEVERNRVRLIGESAHPDVRIRVVHVAQEGNVLHPPDVDGAHVGCRTRPSAVLRRHAGSKRVLLIEEPAQDARSAVGHDVTADLHLRAAVGGPPRPRLGRADASRRVGGVRARIPAVTDGFPARAAIRRELSDPLPCVRLRDADRLANEHGPAARRAQAGELTLAAPRPISAYEPPAHGVVGVGRQPVRPVDDPLLTIGIVREQRRMTDVPAIPPCKIVLLEHPASVCERPPDGYGVQHIGCGHRVRVGALPPVPVRDLPPADRKLEVVPAVAPRQRRHHTRRTRLCGRPNRCQPRGQPQRGGQRSSHPNVPHSPSCSCVEIRSCSVGLGLLPYPLFPSVPR